MQINYLIWSMICGVVMAYWATVAMARFTPLRSMRGWPLTLAVHGAALLVVFGFLGWLKAYGILFGWREGLKAIPAQAVWFALDLTFGGFTRHRRYRPSGAA